MRIFLALVLLVLTSCGVPEGSYYDSSISKVTSGVIVWINDLVSVKRDKSNIPEKYHNLVDSIGKLESIGGDCTVTHIGNNVVITAGHCLRAKEVVERNKPCGFRTVLWGYLDDKEANLMSKCTKILEMQFDDDIDYAIFKVDKAPEAFASVEMEFRPEVGTPLTIFSHPKGRTLEWSKKCKVKPAEDSPLAGLNKFTHRCDTEAGSSGAPVFDEENLTLVGIHNGGTRNLNFASYVYDTPVSKHLRSNPISKFFDWLKNLRN